MRSNLRGSPIRSNRNDNSSVISSGSGRYSPNNLNKNPRISPQNSRSSSNKLKSEFQSIRSYSDEQRSVYSNSYSHYSSPDNTRNYFHPSNYKNPNVIPIITVDNSDSDEDLPDPKIYHSDSEEDFETNAESETEIFLHDLQTYKRYFNNLQPLPYQYQNYAPSPVVYSSPQRYYKPAHVVEYQPPQYEEPPIKNSVPIQISDSVAYEYSPDIVPNSALKIQEEAFEVNETTDTYQERSVVDDNASTTTFVDQEPMISRQTERKKIECREDLNQIFRDLPRTPLVEESSDDDIIFIPPQPDAVVKGDPMEIFKPKKPDFVSPFEEKKVIPKAWNNLTETPPEFFETLNKQDDSNMLADSESWGQPMDEQEASTLLHEEPSKKLRRMSSNRSVKSLVDMSLDSVSSTFLPSRKRRSLLVVKNANDQSSILNASMMLNIDDSMQNLTQAQEYADSETIDYDRESVLIK